MQDSKAIAINFPAILASSVHDMKNSLGTLMALISQLEKMYPEARPPEFEQLQFEANRMNSSILQLLILYKIESSRFSLSIDAYPALDIIQDVMAQQTAMRSLTPIRLVSECPEDLICYCDNTLIGNVIGTIVNNAQRYCRSKILLSAAQEAHYVVLRVEDDGAGYPDGFVTEPGANMSFDPGTGSTGLGLFFAATLAQMHTNGEHRGYIEIDNNSRLGGARFSLYLP
jgi:signal transduction histidine kinase